MPHSVAFLVSLYVDYLGGACVCGVLGALWYVTLLVVLECSESILKKRGWLHTSKFGELNVWCNYCFMVPAVGYSHQFMEIGNTT